MAIPYAPQYGGYTAAKPKASWDFSSYLNNGTTYNPVTMPNTNVAMPSFGMGDMSGQIQQGLSNLGGAAKTGIGADFSKWMSGNKDLVTGGLSAAVGLMGAFNSWQSNKLAKEQFSFQKDAYNADYANQVKQTNSHMADRQYARYAADPTHYQDPTSYMAKWGVK